MTGFPLPPLPRFALSWRQRMTCAAHCFKAAAKQHHRELAPVLRALFPEDAVVFDVGTHAGQFAKLFARLAPRGMVYCFEPAGYARFVFTAASIFTRMANVRLFPLGLGDRVGSLTLETPLKQSGSVGFGLAHLGSDTSGRRVLTERVDVTTIDAFCRCFGVERLDFVKADIEGWEMRMLAGGTEALARFRPALWIEVSSGHLERAGDSAAALWAMLTGLGYRPLRMDGAGGLVAAPGVMDGDIVWIPAEREAP